MRFQLPYGALLLAETRRQHDEIHGRYKMPASPDGLIVSFLALVMVLVSVFGLPKNRDGE